jgi:predicted XRE-type DNA-binding protein
MSVITNNNDLDIGPCGNHGLDGNRMITEGFANVLARAYLDASDEVREVIDAMARIIADNDADAEDRESALDTLTDALFPQMHEGELGIDLSVVKMRPRDETDPTAIEARMADEEATFATRLASLMEKNNVSQEELAERIGVGQPAVSMMLARDCRPQRRTIKKVAEAFNVPPTDLWPDFTE